MRTRSRQEYLHQRAVSPSFLTQSVARFQSPCQRAFHRIIGVRAVTQSSNHAPRPRPAVPAHTAPYSSPRQPARYPPAYRVKISYDAPNILQSTTTYLLPAHCVLHQSLFVVGFIENCRPRNKHVRTFAAAISLILFTFTPPSTSVRMS